jgi:hypothetical protein
MIGVQATDPRNGSRARRRLLSIGADLVAASAWASTSCVRGGLYLRHVADQLPLRSPVLGGVALSAVIGVPYSVLAIQAWRGGRRVDQAAVLWRAVDWLDSGRGASPRGLELLGAVVRGNCAATIVTGYCWLSSARRRDRRLLRNAAT